MAVDGCASELLVMVVSGVYTARGEGALSPAQMQMLHDGQTSDISRF